MCAEKLECLESGDDRLPCKGAVEYRMALSGTGRSFPRCDAHWAKRLDTQDEINRKYPTLAPSDWSPLDAGEQWEED